MAVALYAVRFLLELAVLVALAAWAWGAAGGGLAGAALAAVAAGAAVALWGLLVAPKESRRLADPQRLVVELVVFVAGAAALWAAWGTTPALVLLGAATAIALLIRAVADPFAERPRSL